ncbi:hypothetical protein [Allorhizobium ampelinum]|uniref:hypothetical protein n=1 Tax=Allorhizobium ampelinum TaxID=3025782 RepID=UPI000B401AFC|nr:hypothetical protein [Allorhizobium ampelinum]NTA27417.1 hypothetical protein [Allorhizobium ampelinum]OVE94473.1 hypothetical protein B7W85_13050 [Allorhizobium ampelinum]
MTKEEIIAIFLKAASVDRKLPNTARPKALKAMNSGYYHTAEDIKGWSPEDRHASEWSWLDPEKLKLTKNDVGIWQVAMELIKLCGSELQRRSLWAWAASKAGGMPLAQWAKKVEKIHPETASRRAKAAIDAIHKRFECKEDLHNEKRSEEVLPCEAVLEDKTSTVGVWRADDAKPSRLFFDTDIAGMDYAALQAERRRQKRNKPAADERTANNRQVA